MPMKHSPKDAKKVRMILRWELWLCSSSLMILSCCCSSRISESLERSASCSLVDLASCFLFI